MKAPLRVLIVEDEALISMELEELVEEAGHLVVGTAIRRAEAIDLAFRVLPDLALIDVSLCDGDSGIDVAQAIREIDSLIVVFITANPLRLGEDFAGAAGAIAKPFSRAVLMRGLSYLEECLRHPPPISTPPLGMRMSERFRIA